MDSDPSLEAIASGLKVIAFDIFGTVVDMTDVPAEELHAYGAHIKQPHWSPLKLPESWKKLPAFEDSREGISRLAKKFEVVPMTNGPLDTIQGIVEHNKLEFTQFCPLEVFQVFKPNPVAYSMLSGSMGVSNLEVLMVTANKHFGDIEAARSLGMPALLIRGATNRLITDIAYKLGC